jgi:hypothetical protein
MVDVRLAAVAVGSAILGSSVVLFSLSPRAEPLAPPAAQVTGGEPEVKAVPPEAPVAAASQTPGSHPSVCPPCRGSPLDATEWRTRLATPQAPPAATWDRASVLSLAFPEHQEIAQALAQPDPASRELAALLLNVASERIVGCSKLPAGEGTASDVLDALDRLVATVEAGEQVSYADLTVATAAAKALNEGQGNPPACGMPRGGPPVRGAAAEAGEP